MALLKKNAPGVWLTAPVFAALALLQDLGAGAQSGYRIDRGARQIATDSQRHWQEWHLPKGSLTITPEGGVKPRRWRLNTNALHNILEFLRAHPPEHLAGKAPEEIELLDAIAAGTNREGVLNVLDGDPKTFWEPEPPPANSAVDATWWFSVDLGRVVVADRIVVSFVGEGMGDPFYLFEVLTSDGLKPISAIAGQSLDYLPALQVTEPNTSLRRFEIDFSEVPDETREMVVRFIQIVARGSRLDRGSGISAAEHERLLRESPEDAGAVDFIKILNDGRELPVLEENYERLPEHRRGPVRYYRRERPRVADIEVWQAGEDLARDLVARGGSISSVPEFDNAPDQMFDGDVGTSFKAKYAIPAAVETFQARIVADMGSFFWVRGVQFILRLFGASNNFSMDDYRVDFSDGSRQVDGSLKWVTAAESEETPKFRAFYPPHPQTPIHPTKVESYRHAFEPVKARFLRIVYQHAGDPIRRMLFNATHPFSELRIFSEGYQPEVTLESPLMDLRGTRTLTSIEWDADTPPHTRVVMQTRTSSTKTEVIHYFNGLGKEVTEDKYNKLQKPNPKVKIPDNLLRGDIVTEEVLGSDASPWSQPYFEPGNRITSPSPRDYVQVRATLLSERPEAAPTLEAVRLNYSDPLALSFLGEVTPTRVESLAVERPFTLYVRPDFGPGNPGFDGLLLTAPDGMNLGFIGLFSGAEQDLAGGTGLDGLAVEALVNPTADDSLLVTFPAITPGSGTGLVRLDFSGTLFSVGGLLQAFARFPDGDGGIVWQQVDEGDATAGIDANSLVVVGLQGERELFTDFDLPAVFSPNGDGVNDVAGLGFSVVLVGGSRAVSVDIHDLGGRLVRRLDERREIGAGAYRLEWDGEDDRGRRVPPGVYVLGFHVDADDRGADLERRYVIRSIGVAY